MFDAKKIAKEVVAWTRDWFEKNGSAAHAVIGISGGKDSTVVAKICCEAIGKDRVFGVLMPEGIQRDIGVSRDVAAFLEIEHTEINIKDSVQAVYQSLKKSGIEPNRAAIVNTPARVRMATLYAIAAVKGGRVSNNCNLSEDFVGYSTKFGDAAGDFSPLSRLTVTEVKQIGYALGLPEKFVEKVPEDGLSGKTDEENFGFSYTVLDNYIRTGRIADLALKEKIDRLNLLNRHKLELLPCFEYHP